MKFSKVFACGMFLSGSLGFMQVASAVVIQKYYDGATTFPVYPLATAIQQAATDARRNAVSDIGLGGWSCPISSYTYYQPNFPWAGFGYAAVVTVVCNVNVN
ncbi:hypothetical protein [Xanthomonas sp. MUS 060]|uniref:hypothetical protein n=1 Tax=Xanthomonas sp. MUS 060 TaxID=1588031 RepID=UPI00126A707C|nr:hypothetical protein [Xanthomonas sp. MUS 060]